MTPNAILRTLLLAVVGLGAAVCLWAAAVLAGLGGERKWR